ncbi:PapG chaperone-binding domain-containing protein [Serratia rubidaea]|uniref:PapG chaperone-binding domain-containing protein n=1 Tax=Serratia rubidaea TaxID=61652 RepID=A0ABS0MFR2_SERRU|nr:PapG chaperone-binding domain-containing protein [Serratia rubidaea]MBH1931210.1 hypothetical protein [Serratia rubidaea]MDC6117172.1 PapG chaperone-binding domain-containing protein [Serratia rubidaea]
MGGTLTIDHGVLAAAKVNNAYASQPLYLTCSGETNLRVHVSPYWVYMGGGLLSMISVNGISSDQTLKVGGSTTLTIGSRLSGTAVSPGVHTGFTVISLDII